MPKKTAKAQPKRYEMLRKELLHLIRKGEPGAPLPSYTEMIRNYAVGQATIDRVIREFDSAGLIVRIAGKGIFISDRAVRKNIGLVFGRNIFGAGLSPVTMMLIQHCRDRAAGKKQNFKFYLDIPATNSPEGQVPFHEQLAEDVQTGRLDGAILVWSYGPEQKAWLAGGGVPFVSLEQFDGENNAVVIDYLDLLRKGTLALAAQGCRRIALLSPFGYLRKEGYDRDIKKFAATLRSRGLKFDEKWVLDDRSSASIDSNGAATHEELGFQILQRAAGASQALPFDGIVSLDDMLTRGAIASLKKLNIGIGSQVRIATHANRGSPALQGEENLTLLQVDPSEIVDAMFSILEPLMDGQTGKRSRISILAKVEAVASPAAV
jgi:DNA-binding LacI/PurR family transcriptional regulator